MQQGVNDRMRADWNQRAREDANYYVAFGRRGQDDDEFFDTALEIVRSFETELKRLPAGANRRAWRALEIGCGPGRLMRPLSRHFGEIHGVDISDRMIELAAEKLRDIPHAHAHHTAGSDLAAFADESFDFVYSYAVFQHIPDRDVIFQYLREATRVLKQGGIARFQLNGLPASATQYDTWSGARIASSEIATFARENDLQLLALEGIATQYMWTTWKKRPSGWIAALKGYFPVGKAKLQRITNTFSSEPVVPTRGRFASASLWFENLPEACDLNYLRVTIGGESAFVTYIGPADNNGLQQVNVYLPQGLNSGLQPLEVHWLGELLCEGTVVRVVPPGPPVPRVMAVTDGIDLLSGKKIITGTVKVVLEEVTEPAEFRASLGGKQIVDFDSFCTDPRVPKYEINFKTPPDLGKGVQFLEMSLGSRRFAPVRLELA